MQSKDSKNPESILSKTNQQVKPNVKCEIALISKIKINANQITKNQIDIIVKRYISNRSNLNKLLNSSQ